MKKDNKNKKIITLVISIFIILILVLTISYAYFSTRLDGSDQIVKVGELELVLNETSEGITLDNAIGISDEDGMNLTPSTFELRNNGNNAVDYTIYLDDNTIGDTDTRIDDMFLKYNLNKNGKNSGATLLTRTGSNSNRVLDSGTIEGGGTNAYSLNLWITDEVDGNYSGQVFSGKLRVEVSQERAKEAGAVLLENIPGENKYDDGVDTFITGTDPNNYIWYSGKLWRAVLINNEEKTVKLVTQWDISAISYDDDSSSFAGSYMEEWLNDTSVDGFLGNLRDYENFIVTDAKWDATESTAELGSVTRPNGTNIVEDPVGLINIYEYQSSNNGNVYSYLNNNLYFWTLTPYNVSNINILDYNGYLRNRSSSNSYGIRPAIILRSEIKIVSGTGTEDNPYRLEGDNDTNLSGTLLNTRYSGEYIRFGNDENNLYRIVSHENGIGTKITSAEPLKDSGTFKTITFGNLIYSSTNTIGTFLNGEYLINYIDSSYSDMIEESSTWYLGIVGNGTSYKLAKYTDTDMTGYTTSTESKVGLLRIGELMSGQFNKSGNNAYYWLLTPFNPNVCNVSNTSDIAVNTPGLIMRGIKPSLNLKSNVIITSGDGTRENPFEIALQ